MRYVRKRVFDRLSGPELVAIFKAPILAPDPEPVGESYLYRGSFSLGPGWPAVWEAVARERLVGHRPIEYSPAGSVFWLTPEVDVYGLAPGDEVAFVDALGAGPLGKAHLFVCMVRSDGQGSASVLVSVHQGDAIEPGDALLRASVLTSVAVRGADASESAHALLVRQFLLAVGIADRIDVDVGPEALVLRPDEGRINLAAPVPAEAADPCLTGRPWCRLSERNTRSDTHLSIGLCLSHDELRALMIGLLREAAAVPRWTREKVDFAPDSSLLASLARWRAPAPVTSTLYAPVEAEYDVEAVVEIARQAERLDIIVRTVTPPECPLVTFLVNYHTAVMYDGYDKPIAPKTFSVEAHYEEPREGPEPPVEPWLDAVRSLDPAHTAFGYAMD